MAEIRIENLRHSYSANPQGEEDYALKRLSITWQDGGAYQAIVTAPERDDAVALAGVEFTPAT